MGIDGKPPYHCLFCAKHDGSNAFTTVTEFFDHITDEHPAHTTFCPTCIRYGDLVEFETQEQTTAHFKTHFPEKKTRKKKTRAASASGDELVDELILRKYPPAVECPVHRGKFHVQGASCYSCSKMPATKEANDRQLREMRCRCGVVGCDNPWHEYAKWLGTDTERWAWHHARIDAMITGVIPPAEY